MDGHPAWVPTKDLSSPYILHLLQPITLAGSVELDRLYPIPTTATPSSALGNHPISSVASATPGALRSELYFRLPTKI